MKISLCLMLAALFIIFDSAIFSQEALSQSSKNGTTLFQAINCKVLDNDGKALPVVAYRNMSNKDEVILISKTADHALIVNFKEEKAFKVHKPLLGTNTVSVSNERPEQSGNIGFMFKKDASRKRLTEIIVHFKDESCFLCGSLMFASIWD